MKRALGVVCNRNIVEEGRRLHLGQKTKALSFLKKFMGLRAVWNGGIHGFEDAEKRMVELSKRNSRFLAEEIKKASEMAVV